MYLGTESPEQALQLSRKLHAPIYISSFLGYIKNQGGYSEVFIPLRAVIAYAVLLLRKLEKYIF